MTLHGNDDGWILVAKWTHPQNDKATQDWVTEPSNLSQKAKNSSSSNNQTPKLDATRDFISRTFENVFAPEILKGGKLV